MFTGIITEMAQISAVNEGRNGSRQLWIEGLAPNRPLDLGASVAHAGVCLTIIEQRPISGPRLSWCVEASAETMNVTTLGSWKEGQLVNIEHALRMGDALGGHMVSGHVDGLATLASLTAADGSYQLIFEVDAVWAPFIAKKGSIALDGVSLTVNSVDLCCFSVNIIPHTWDHTTLSALKVGDTVNLEIDTLARYMARYLELVPNAQ